MNTMQFGPYNETQSEKITEEMLGSKGMYMGLERMLRGEMSPGAFLYLLQNLAEDVHQEHFSEAALAQQLKDASEDVA